MKKLTKLTTLLVILNSLAAAGYAIGEAGSTGGLGDRSWSSVGLDSSAFDSTPIVLTTTHTTNGGQDPSDAQVRSVSQSGFDIRHCEYDGGDSCDGHADETNSWIAIDPSKTDSLEGIQAGTVSVSDSNSPTVSFDTSFSNTPLVFAQFQTHNGNDDSMNIRVHSVSTSDFTLDFCEQDGSDGCDSHTTETAGWVAVDPNTFDSAGIFDFGTTSMGDSNWNSVSFSQSYSSTPAIDTMVQTESGSQEAVYPEANSLSTGGADVRYCESDGGDGCDSHNTETVAWMTASKGRLVINRPPSASFNFNPSSPSIGESTIFDASVSSDRDGTISSYRWDFGDGSTATGKIPSLSFSSPGDYSVGLTVTDDDGATDTSSQTVTVSDSTDPSISNPSPTGSIETGSPTISADFSDNNDLASYTLDIDGSQVDSGSLSGTSDSASYPASGLSDGDHSYTWNVTDSAGNSYTEFVQFSINTNDAPNTPTLISPSDGESPVKLDPELKASVSDPDGDSMDVTFYVDTNNDGNFDTEVTDTGVANGGTASASLSSLDAGQQINWYVESTDPEGLNTRGPSTGEWSFTTVGRPDNPSSESPSNGAVDVSTSDNLEVYVNHPDNLDMTVNFDMDGNNVGSDTVSGSGTANVSPSLGFSEVHSWSVDVYTQGYSTQSSGGPYSFSSEHDFRVDQVSPADGDTAVGLNDSVSVEVFHSSDRSIDVEFYFSDTISGTPDAREAVTSSGSAVNATIDSSNFDNFGETTGTLYNWSYRVDDGASDTNNITGEGLNFTTVYTPNVGLQSPNDNEENVDIDGDLEVDVQQEDGFSTGTSIFLKNSSGDEFDTDSQNALGTKAGNTLTYSLSNFDFIEAGEEYVWNATASIPNPGGLSTIENSTGTNSFTVSERPEVESIEPVDEKTGISANPLLNVTADHAGKDQLTVEFYDWEKTGSEALIGSKDIASGDTASINISDEEIGDAPEVYRWYVNVTTESGTSWSNEASPYEFTIPSIGSLDYAANIESGINLNPDNAADQGLDSIVGQDSITFQVSNNVGAEMPGIGFNVSDGTTSEVFGEIDDVESGSAVTVDLEDSALIEEDQAGYEIYAFYQESGTDFTGEDFRSDRIEFSTHVAELEWVDPGRPGNQPIEEYRVYHNNESAAFSVYDYVGGLGDDGSTSFTVGAAPLDLGDSTVNECFSVVSWNVAGESDPTSEQCVGVVP